MSDTRSAELGSRAGAASAPGGAGALRRLGLTAAALLAALALLALGLLHLQQIEQLNRSLQASEEVQGLYMQRQLSEYLQLREEWALALGAQQPLDLAPLEQRMAIWLGRIDLLREQTDARRIALALRPQLDDDIARIDAFARRVEAALAQPLSDAQRRDALARLRPELLELGHLMQDLPLAVSHLGTTRRVERAQQLSRYSRFALGVTALLALAAVAFAVLALRQMQLLRQRQAALETLARELARARVLAEESSQAKSRFLANMSHEIRTPFQGLLGMLRLLRETPLQARQIDYLRTATESADHLLAVLTDILDFSQLEAGRLQLHPAPTTLRKLLLEVEAAMRPQADARGIALQVDVDHQVPARARLDATRVKQVLFNLLSNAIKFAGRGEVVLELRLRDAGAAAPRLEFAVVDQGPGMDEATLARIFDRFERADTASSGSDGSGLGLAIARGLAERMGGELHASSRPGAGSRFSFMIPLDPAPEVDELPPAFDDIGAPPAQALDVLVAEDHPVNRQVIGALLESLGHRAHFVASGGAAVSAVQERAYDLVLMDLHMPDVDGIEATRRIRALPDHRAATLPIVALTADAFTDTRERCLMAGMNSFLSKPVGREKLAAVLRQLYGSTCAQLLEAPAESTANRPPVGPALDEPPASLIDPLAAQRGVQLLGAPRYAQVLEAHLDEAGAVVAAMRSAVREAQPHALAQHAHAARGAAANLGLQALAATAAALEEGASSLPAHEIARLVQRFEDRIELTRAAARRAMLLPTPEPARE